MSGSYFFRRLLIGIGVWVLCATWTALAPSTVTAAPPRQDAPPTEITALRTDFVPLFLAEHEDAHPRTLYRLSPDGTLLAVVDRESRLCVYPVDDSPVSVDPIRCDALDVSLGALIWSPQSDALLFHEDTLNGSVDPDLWLLDMDGNGPINLTPDDVDRSDDEDALRDLFPAWGADGETIYFARFDRSEESAVYRLHSLRLDDDEPVDLGVVFDSNVTDFDWSLSTKQVFFSVTNRDNAGLYQVDIESGDITRLLPALRSSFSAIAVAPGGGAVLALAHAPNNNSAAALIVIDPATGRTVRQDLTTDIVSASWLPDGRGVVFWAVGGESGLKLRYPWWRKAAPIDLGAYQPVTALVEWMHVPLWQGQDRLLVYDADDQLGLLQVSGLTLSAPAPDSVPPLTAADYEAPPGWQVDVTPFGWDLSTIEAEFELMSIAPDLGFALLRRREDESDLCLLRLPAETQPACFTLAGPVVWGSEQWPTDSRHLLMGVTTDVGNVLVIVDPLTGVAVPLPETSEVVGWSANQMPLTLSDADDSAREIQLVDVFTGAAETVALVPDSIRRATLSTSTQRLAYITTDDDETTLWEVDLAAFEPPTERLTLAPEATTGLLRFAADGQVLVLDVIDRNANPPLQTHYFLADGSGDRLGVGSGSNVAAWHPRGLGVVLAAPDPETDGTAVSVQAFAHGVTLPLPDYRSPFDSWWAPLPWTDDGVLLRNAVTGALELVQLTPLETFTLPVPHFVQFQAEPDRRIELPVSLSHPEHWEIIDDSGRDKLSYLFVLADEPDNPAAVTSFAGVEVYPHEEDDKRSPEAWLLGWFDEANLTDELTPLDAPQLDVTDTYTAVTQSFTVLAFDVPLTVTATALIYADYRVMAVHGNSARGEKLYPDLSRAVIESLDIARSSPFPAELPLEIAEQMPSLVAVAAWKTLVDLDAEFTLRYPLAWPMQQRQAIDGGALVQMSSRAMPSRVDTALVIGLGAVSVGVPLEPPPSDDPEELLATVIVELGAPTAEPITPIEVDGNRIVRSYDLVLSDEVTLRMTLLVELDGDRYGVLLGGVYLPDVDNQQAVIDEILASFQFIEVDSAR